jgi:putative ATP-grasp target RiPP
MSASNHADSPVSPVSGRFPLGRPPASDVISEQGPSQPGVRPFGLRFARPVDGPSPGTALPWRFCPARQVAVVDDGSGRAWYRQLGPLRKTTMATTGPSPDGGGSTGNEEWTPDYVGDASP